MKPGLQTPNRRAVDDHREGLDESGDRDHSYCGIQ